MVLSNYKSMLIRIQISKDPIPVITSTFQTCFFELRSKVILLILQLETDYFPSYSFQKMLHSKQWHYSLHRDFQNCYSTRRSPTGFFSSNSTSTYKLHTRVHIHPENSPSRIQFYMQKTESSLSTATTTTYRGQRDLHSRKEILHIEGKEIF